MAASSPVSSLPPELLAEIMSLAKSGIRSFPHKSLPEVLYSHVSKFWREVSLSTCRLWGSINIYSYHSRHRVNAYLQRSGSTPIHLSIDIHRADRRNARKNPPYLSRLLRFLTATLEEVADRMERFHLFCFYEETAVRLLSRTTSLSAHILQYMQLKYDCTMNSTFNPQSQAIFCGSLPRIKELQTDLPDFLPPRSLSPSLTTLYLHYMKVNSRLKPDSCVDYLKSLANLRHLSLQGSIELDGWGPNLTFEMPNLRSLRLMDDGMMAVHIILSITAPSLESLWLDCSFIPFHTLFDSPRMRGATKFPTLQYLTLCSDNSFRSERFAGIFPTITYIHVPYAVMQRHFHLFTNVLVQHWTSLHTIVLTMYKESNVTQLVAGLNTILPIRKRHNMPIRQLVLDADYRSAILKDAPTIADQVDIVPISMETYREHWWTANLRDKQDTDGIVFAS